MLCLTGTHRSRYLCFLQPNDRASDPMRKHSTAAMPIRCQALAAALSLLFCCSLPLAAAPPKSSANEAIAKLSVRIEAPESEVATAVQQVTQDQIIHGTYSYEKERILYGAHSAESAKVFGVWKGSGKAYYKVAENVLSPRFFKDSEDIGTISVRYVVQSVDANASILEIDAVFVDARNVHHPSLGNVESSEYSAITEHLRNLQAHREQALQAIAKSDSTPPLSAARIPESVQPVSTQPAQPTIPELQEHIDALRHKVELRVKNSGAQIRSAPFHSAAALETLPGETEVLILVITPYWYGVETENGHHGWIHHSQLESLP